MKILNSFEIMIILSCCVACAKEDSEHMKVATNNTLKMQRVCSNTVKVIDGDTIDMACQRFRFACVDTPESIYKGRTQYCLDNETDCGKLAKEALETIVSKGIEESWQICCGWIKKDRYLGWCDNNHWGSVPFDKTINYSLIIGGYAWFYDGGKEFAVFKEPFLEA